VCSGNSIFDGYCYNYTPSQIAAFPPMSLVLDNVTLNMKPTDYIGTEPERQASRQQATCLIGAG